MCVKGAVKGLTLPPAPMDSYMLCHAQAAKPVFPYGPFKLQCVFERSQTHTKGTSLPEVGIERGFSNSNYNKTGRN